MTITAHPDIPTHLSPPGAPVGCKPDIAHAGQWQRHEPCGYCYPSRRWVVLGGPGGAMTCMPVNCPARRDSYVKNWTVLATFKRPQGWLPAVDRRRLYRIYDAVMRVWGLT